MTSNFTDASFNFERFVTFSLTVVAAALLLLCICGATLQALFGHSLFARVTLSGSLLFAALSLYQPARELIGETVFAHALVATLFVTAAALIFWITKMKDARVATAIFAVAVTLVTAPGFVSSVAAQFGSAGQVTRQVDFGSEGAIADSERPHPNIYYIIVDAFASTKTMQERFGLDMSEFISRMEMLGFYHASESRSSYTRTMFTLGSIFNLDYYVEDDPDLIKKLYPRVMRETLVPPLVAAVRQAGYETALAGNYWGPCVPTYVRCIGEEEQNAIPYQIRMFLEPTPLRDLPTWIGNGASSGPSIDVDAIGKALAHLKREGVPQKPTLMFIHHLAPHPPYQWKADCSLRDKAKFDFSSWSGQAKSLFLDNAKCVSLQIEGLAQFIAQNDPEAIVVFQGDHGTAFSSLWSRPFSEWSEETIYERTGILNLIRANTACGLPLQPAINNVNTVRFVLSCVLGSGPDYLRNSSFLTTGDKDSPSFGKLYEITSLGLPEGSVSTQQQQLIDQWKSQRKLYLGARNEYESLLALWRAERKKWDILKREGTLTTAEAKAAFDDLRERYVGARDRFHAMRTQMAMLNRQMKARDISIPDDN